MTQYLKVDKDDFSTYFKYISDDAAVIDGIFLNHKIRFTQSAALNDPLESFPQIDLGPDSAAFEQRYEYQGDLIPSYMDILRNQIIETYYNEFGILSLTKQPLNHMMWCQYANGHKGVCLELKEDFINSPSFTSSLRPPLKIIKVDYVKDFRVDFQPYVADGKITFDDFEQKIIKRKTEHWGHEKEYRVVRSLAESCDYNPQRPKTSHRDHGVYTFDFSLDCVNSVIFGVKTSPCVKKKIIQACEGYNIGFIQAIIVGDDGVQMSILNIKEFGSLDHYLSLKPQVFLTDLQQLGQPYVLTVSVLDEIPYYAGYGDLIDEYLKNKKNNKVNQK